MKKILIALLATCSMGVTAKAQQVAVKTNILYDATTTPNLGAEMSVGKKSSVQLFYGLNPWKYGNNKKLRHWSLMPEYRYWFCRPFTGHFVGVHALGGQFNMGGVKLPFGAFPSLRTHRYEGWFAGGGLTYGYSWILGKHWNVEAAVGVGYAYIKYKEFECKTCGKQLKEDHKNYIGPTKAALNLVYVF